MSIQPDEMPVAFPIPDEHPFPPRQLTPAPDSDRGLAQAARALGAIADESAAEQELVELLRESRKFPKQREIIRRVLTIAGALKGLDTYEQLEAAARKRADDILRDAGAQVVPIRQEAERIRAEAHAFYAKERAAIEAKKAEVERQREELLKPHAEALELLNAMLDLAGYVKSPLDGKRQPIPSPVFMHAVTGVASICGKNPVHIDLGSTPPHRG